jgi:Tfp pilus assembly protein FimT
MQSQKTSKNYHAFTLLEILLVVALMTIIAVVTIGFDKSYIARNDLSLSTESVIQSLRRSRMLSQTMSYDDMWGVHLTSNQIIVFKGSDFALRDVDYDEVYTVPSTISFSGINDIKFEKQTGIPTTTGNININSSINSSSVISINTKGLVEL